VASELLRRNDHGRHHPDSQTKGFCPGLEQASGAKTHWSVGGSRMACVARTYPDNTRTTSQMSGDTPPGQTRTYAFRHVQMSGVRTFEEWRKPARHWHECVDIQRRAFSAIASRSRARSTARVSQRVFLLTRYRVALNPSSHQWPSYGLARRIGSNIGSSQRISTDRSVQNQSLESVVSPICTFGAARRKGFSARSLMTNTLGRKDAHARARRTAKRRKWRNV
jgi:hypothetical protein